MEAIPIYTNDARLQSVVLFEDVIYSCNDAHQSGETFAENSSKFTSAGSGGGIDILGVVAGAITDALALDGQITLGVEAILATKHFNSYGGEWNAGGQYDGNLNFTQFSSYASYDQNTFHLNGDGDLQSDGKYWGLVRDTSVTIPPGGLSFDVILPYMQYGQPELAFEMREVGTFGDLSANQKFCRFSFVNIDDSGFSPIMQLTITYCSGTNDVITEISPITLPTGERVVLSLTPTSVSAYRYTTGAWDYLGSAYPGFTATELVAYLGYSGPNNSFIVTQGAKDIRLPPEPRLYKTYKAISTDTYSTLYGKAIKNNDLVTFILDSNNNEDILVESAADLSYTTRRGDFLSVTTSSAQTTPLSVDLTTAYLTNLTDRAVEICNFTTVSYTTAGDPFTAGIAINFNTTANGFDVGRSYAIGEIMQVAFDTRGGNAIQNITFESPIASTIGPFTVDAEKYVVFTFTAVPKEGTTYGTTIRCIGKWEL